MSKQQLQLADLRNSALVQENTALAGKDMPQQRLDSPYSSCMRKDKVKVCDSDY
jgi:hypothetical protein